MRIDVTNIIVMGVSGCGKSSLGALLAMRLGVTFLEGDEFHPPANVARMSRGEPLRDADRWPWFDELCAAVLSCQDPQVVVSCSALKRAYRQYLRARLGVGTRFLWLDLPREQLLRRMQAREHFMPASLLDSQLHTLEPPEDEADVLRLEAAALETQVDRACRFLDRVA